MLAQNKIHINTKILERAIVLPRDIDAHHPGYPSVMEMLAVNPYKEKKEVKKKRVKKDVEDNTSRFMRAPDGRKVPAMYGAVLRPNHMGEYKVFEYGNFPLVLIDG